MRMPEYTLEHYSRSRYKCYVTFLGRPKSHMQFACVIWARRMQFLCVILFVFIFHSVPRIRMRLHS